MIKQSLKFMQIEQKPIKNPVLDMCNKGSPSFAQNHFGKI